MDAFKNILFFADRDDGMQEALQRAVELSTTNSARLTVMDVTPEATMSDLIKRSYGVDLNVQMREQRLRELEELVSPYVDSGVPVYTKVTTGIAFVELVRAVLRNAHDLVIKVAQDDRDTLAPVLGSTDMHLLRKCPCPIWIERVHKPAVHRRILAAVDPLDDDDAELSGQILKLATTLAARENAQLDIVHAWELPGESMFASGRGRVSRKDLDAMLVSTEGEHRQALDALLSEYDLDSEAHNVYMIKGRPASVISNYASELEADLIVMGTVARVGIPGLIIGNTAEDVLRDTRLSVLAVKPQGFISPVK